MDWFNFLRQMLILVKQPSYRLRARKSKAWRWVIMTALLTVVILAAVVQIVSGAGQSDSEGTRSGDVAYAI